jgi:hypothetical protein
MIDGQTSVCGSPLLQPDGLEAVVTIFSLINLLQ